MQYPPPSFCTLSSLCLPPCEKRFQPSIVVTYSVALCAKACHDSSTKKKNLGPAIPFQDSRTSGFQFPDLCFSQTFLFSCRIINSCWIQASYLLSSTNQQPQHQVVPSFLIFLACQLPGICRGNRQPPITPRNPPWTAWTTPGPWIFTTSDFVIAIAWNKSDRTPKTMNKC